MTEILTKHFAAERTRIALDWLVFSAGVVALTIAIGATVASKTSFLNAEVEPASAPHQHVS